MSAILYTLINGEVSKEKVSAIDVDHLLNNGYSDCPDKLIKHKAADANESGKLSSQEIKDAAKKAGIVVGRKSIKTLKKELGM